MEHAVIAVDRVLVWITLALLFAFFVAERHRRGERRKALRYLLLGQMCWCVEVAHRWAVGSFDASTPEHLPYAVPYFVLNAGVAAFFFTYGHALLGIKSRMHPVLEGGAWHLAMPFAAALERFGDRPIPGRVVVGIAAAGVVIATVVVLIYPGRLVLVELPGAALSFVGMAVLGLGLLRELARKRLDFVSAVCGGSLLAYSIVQLGRLIPSLNAEIRVAALVLKVTYLIALGSYWTLIREMTRARDAERERNEQVASVLQLFQNDLHDHALGKLSAARRFAELALDNDEDPKPDLRNALQAVVLAQQTIDRLARMELTIDDLPWAIRNLCESLEDKSLQLEHVVEIEDPIDGALAHKILAIASTAIDNVRQHSGARRANVRLRMQGDDAELTVMDDGHGFDANDCRKWRNGMRSIKQRLSDLGGRLDVSSNHDGTTLTARFPCR